MKKGVKFEQDGGGVSVVVDNANCVVLRRMRLDGPEYMTVTHIDRLVQALRAAQRFIADEEDHDRPPVLLEIAVEDAEALRLAAWHLDPSSSGFADIDVVGLVDRLAEAAAS